MQESLIASGYPMLVDITQHQTNETLMKRGTKLGQATPGSGHDCFLKGITIQFDLTAPEYFWRQMDRYHFMILLPFIMIMIIWTCNYVMGVQLI